MLEAARNALETMEAGSTEVRAQFGPGGPWVFR